MIIRTTDERGHSYLLRPNGSLGWRRAQCACLLLVTLSLAIAAGFAALGAWMVLPFAGLEMLVVCAGTYLSCRWSAQGELVRLEADELVVQRGRTGPEQEFRLPRPWSRVVLLRDPRGWYPSRLQLRSHGRCIEIGARLTEDERLELAGELAEKTRLTTTFGRARPSTEAQPEPTTIAT